jgi:hypothetical protein
VSYVKIRIVAVAAVAMLAALALSAARAAALPEFGQCFKNGPGSKYTEAACVTKATKTPGEWEWRKASMKSEAAKRRLEGTGGATVLTINFRVCEPGQDVRAQKCKEGETENTVLGETLTCESETNTGEISGPKKLSNVALTLRGCALPGLGSGRAPCSNTGIAGEVRSTTLKGMLGYISKPKLEVGLQLNPTRDGATFFTAACPAIGLDVNVGIGNESEGCVYPLPACGGSGVISAIGPLDTMTSALSQTFAVDEAEAENVPSKFEGATSPLEALEAYLNAPGTPGTTMWSKAGLAGSNNYNAAEAWEIKAK